MSVGERGEHIAVPPDRKGAAIAVLDKHPCVLPESVRYAGTILYFKIDMGKVPNGEAPSIGGVILRDIALAIARRP